MQFYDDIEEDDFYQMDYGDNTKKVALYIMDKSGEVEDIIIDLDEILKYVKKLYEKYPTAD